MILLTSTSDELRLVTSDASSIDVQSSWAERAGSTVTPGRTNTLISTAATTVIVASPGASNQRTVKTVSIRNRHATQACRVTVVHRQSGPTDAEMLSALLPPGSSLCYDEHNKWRVMRAPYGFRSKRSELQITAPTVGVLYTHVLANDVVNANATANRLKEVRELGFWVAEGTRVWFRYALMYTSAATTTGSRWTIYGPGSTTALRYESEYSLTATSKTQNQGVSAYDSPAASSASSAATGANIATLQGWIDTPTCDGLVFPRFASEILSSAITLKAGSTLMWQRVT